MPLPQYQIFLVQLVPIAALLLPFVEAVGLAVHWRRSLSSPWLYAAVGIVVAYAVAAGVVFASEKYEVAVRSRSGGGGEIILRDDGHIPKQPEASQAARPDSGPMFSPLTGPWFFLVILVAVSIGIALWALKLLFASGQIER